MFTYFYICMRKSCEYQPLIDAIRLRINARNEKWIATGRNAMQASQDLCMKEVRVVPTQARVSRLQCRSRRSRPPPRRPPNYCKVSRFGSEFFAHYYNHHFFSDTANGHTDYCSDAVVYSDVLNPTQLGGLTKDAGLH